MMVPRRETQNENSQVGLPQPHFDQWASLLPSMDAFMAPPDDDDGPHTDQADRRRTQFPAASDLQPRVDARAQKSAEERCTLCARRW